MDRSRRSVVSAHLCALLAAMALMASSPAVAAPVLVNYDVDFSSPSQGIWGPGKSAASFGIDQFLLGNGSFGLRFETGASTGSVTSHYNGAVSVAYNDLVGPGLVPLALGYQGDPNGGGFDTALGAFVLVRAYFPVIGAQTVTNPDYFLDISRTYTPSPADSTSGSDSFTPASSSIGPNIPPVGSAEAGIDYDIVQNATHAINALTGEAVATHQTSGEVRTAPFSLGSTANIMLDLDAPGVWDVELTNLALDNLFSTDFDLAFVPFMQYTIGFGCGNAGTDSDNGPLCGGDGRLSSTLAHINLFSNTPFGLALTSGNALAAFQITVDESLPPSVPEPGSLSVVALGLTALALRRRRRTAAV